MRLYSTPWPHAHAYNIKNYIIYNHTALKPYQNRASRGRRKLIRNGEVQLLLQSKREGRGIGRA